MSDGNRLDTGTEKKTSVELTCFSCPRRFFEKQMRLDSALVQAGRNDFGVCVCGSPLWFKNGSVSGCGVGFGFIRPGCSSVERFGTLDCIQP